jgi:hypothetical protein
MSWIASSLNDRVMPNWFSDKILNFKFESLNLLRLRLYKRNESLPFFYILLLRSRVISSDC